MRRDERSSSPAPHRVVEPAHSLLHGPVTDARGVRHAGDSPAIGLHAIGQQLAAGHDQSGPTTCDESPSSFWVSQTQNDV